MMPRTLTRPVLAAALSLACLPAIACGINVAPLSFGSINPLDRIDTDSVTVVTVTCPADTPFSMAASAGNGSYVERRMTSGSSWLAYQLYVEASRTLIWGDGTAGTGVISGNAGTAGVATNVYGRVPAQPLAVPGAYNDTLVVTVTY